MTSNAVSLAVDLVGARGPGAKVSEPGRVVTALSEKLIVNHRSWAD